VGADVRERGDQKMKKASLIILAVFSVLSCRAMESDTAIAFQGVTADIQELRDDIQRDILKLLLEVRALSATNSYTEDLSEKFVGKLSLRDEFALSGKPRYQSITVVNSTFPEIQTGTTFKSDSYGHHFYFNGYFLTVGKVFLSSYTDEFGNRKIVKGFQFGLGNNPCLAEDLQMAKIFTGPLLRNFGPKQINYTLFLSNELEKDIRYPLKLTNDLCAIEFSEPQPLTHKNQPLTSGDTERR
jgi:hypothetical protein